MKPGTPGFVGERLEEGREARGLTVTALADLIGVTRQAVGQYEANQQTPHPEVMRLISERLNLPVSFFREAGASPLADAVFFRSLASATKAHRARTRRLHGWVYRLAHVLEEYVDLPPVTVPRFELPSDPAAISSRQIEELATATRAALGLGSGPIGNMVWLMENAGAVVSSMDLELQDLDGLSGWMPDGRPYVLLSADKESAVRSRLDAAHEFAHLILHRNVEPAALANRTVYNLVEQQAFQFAAAFLLPLKEFADDLATPSLDGFLALKSRWRVSIGMMIMRAHHAGFMSDDRRQKLYIGMSRRGWRSREPLDDQLIVESPQVLRKSIELLFTEDILDSASLLDEVRLAKTDVERISGIADLSRRLAPVVQLRDRRPEPRPPVAGPEKSGEVVTFPDPVESRRA